MSLSAGTRLGPYEILALIGAGGMGEVYKARDTRLDRIVAIKVSKEQFSERFEREARAVAALNHPNICALYDVGPNYLVMEYIEGPTLAGPIALDEALPIARQIAEALEAAHEKGFIHRDLKPANIKLTADGKVKVLDFGLAKAFDAEPRNPSSDPANSPTLTISATRAGMILGTAGYMSPEQARGLPVDKRADIWAYGVVLYEILTGREVFAGETVSDALAAVLKTDVDWTSLPTGTPTPIRRLLRRCLERDRKKRLRDIGDAIVEIDEAPEAAATVHQTGGASRWWIALAGVFALIILGLAAVHFRETPPEQRLSKTSILPPDKSTFESLAISPDGRRLAFIATESGKSRLWVRPLDSVAAQPLADADGGSQTPFWSPDSRFVAFFAGGKLKKIEASGGPPQALCDARNGRSGTWNRDGMILFSTGITSGALSRVPVEGGAAKLVSSLEGSTLENNRRWPAFLPDGRHYLFTSYHGIQLGALDSNETIPLLDDRSNAAYSASASGAGYLLFGRGGSLMAQPFDASKLRLSGGPFPVAEQVGYRASSYLAEFSVSENGVLVYDSAGAAQNDQLAWFDRTGKRLGSVGEPGQYLRLALSPDEKQVAVDRFEVQSSDIWLIELARGISTRFTFDPKDDTAPVWSPDGRSISFASNREGAYDVYRKTSTGAGKEELLLKSANPKFPSDWSPDGRLLLYYEINPKTKYDLWVLPDPGGAPGDKKPMPYVQTEFNEVLGAFSPDGKWIAYQSDESGRFEVFVQTFPATGAKWQVSKGGGSHAKWRRDGKELFYLGADRKMTAVEVKIGATFQAGNPLPLFETRITNPFVRYAVTGDGQRFLLPASMGEAGPTVATVVLNWTAGIKR